MCDITLLWGEGGGEYKYGNTAKRQDEYKYVKFGDCKEAR